MSNIIKQWNGRTIRVREDRYVSLTDMAQASGKLFGDWKRLKSTESYLSTLSTSMQIPIDQLIQVNESSGTNDSRGTWGHPKASIRFAQWCSDEFAVQVDMWVDELMTTGKVVLKENQQAPLKDIKWQKRLVLFLEKSVIPYDYFCIFTEATCGLISQFESLGYVLPEDATIDISIGQHWANFLRTQVDDIEKYRQKYPHYYPDSRGMKEANMYKLDLLPMFRRWMETDYKMRHLENYLKTKDKQAIYILADLMGIQFLPGMFEGNKKMIGL